MAKRFDQEEILTRLMQRLQVDENWSSLVTQGTIGNVLSTIAESNAEIARYLEYLYNEKKWLNARNMSSVTHLTDLISYKRNLPKSAIGFIIVSHTDIEGTNRLNNFGSKFFDLDAPSDWDNLVKKPNASWEEKAALVPWTADKSYIIPEGTVFKTASGIVFTSIETVESRSLKEPFNTIKGNPKKYQDFIKAGGWNGIKYVKVPVIQGNIQKVQLGRASGQKLESFVIDDLQMENASNILSNKYLKLEVSPIIMLNGKESISKTEIWEQIPNIRLASPYDKVFEKKILNEQNKVLIKVGDGITGQQLPERSRIALSYLQTAGENGNIEKFQITEMIFPIGFSSVDPRTNAITNFLSSTNIVPIRGGKNIESKNDIKQNAPASYLETTAVATKESYLSHIISNSPVNLLHCKIFQSSILEQESYGDNGKNEYVSMVQDGVLTEISLNKNALLITGIRSNGTKIEDPENELIIPLIQSLDDKSSPNDHFDYIEPNFIEIRPNITVNTSDSITEDEIKNNILPEILGKYSIFSTNFEKPFYKSNIVDIVHNYAFSKYCSVFLEAKAKTSLLPEILITESTNESRDNIYRDNEQDYMNLKTLLNFEFQFDQTFAKDLLKAGFKNFKQDQNYILRLDLKFKNAPTNNKTFLLLDNRFNTKNILTPLEAENYPINEKLPIPEILQTTYNKDDLKLFDYKSIYFKNQQVRTAQYDFIDNILSISYLHQLREGNRKNNEITYVFTDENGDFKLFPKKEINILQSTTGEKNLYVNTLMEPTENISDIQGEACYWRNTKYIPNCKIIFYENYEKPKHDKYAKGNFIIPLNKIMSHREARTVYEASLSLQNYDDIAKEIELVIKNNITIDIYAQPISDDIECTNPYDIIFTSQENCLIEKNFVL